MQSKLLSALFSITFLLTISGGAFATHHEHDHATEESGLTIEEAAVESKKAEIKETITHHLLDEHSFTLVHGVSLPLPVILWDNGLQVFSSSRLHHGESVAEVNGNYYMLYHSKIYKTDAQGTIEYDEHHHPTNAQPLDLSITKNVLTIFLMGLLMIFLFRGMARTYQKGPMPKGIGRFIEPIIIFIRDEIAIPNIGEKHYKRFMGYLLTVFFFVWFMNLAGMLPLGLNVTGNIAVTFTLAIITFLITQFSGKKDYWLHIFWMPGVPVFMKFLLAPIELLGIFIKPFALMIRLYANIKAGHVVLMSLIGVMFVFDMYAAKGAFFGLTFALSLLELLVAALQAYIFTMLSALYFGAAVEEHDHH
ncbi:MAG: F0F1 ATP synthase subunit A [Leptolyngbya sp. SIO3F4]|nr:F0F1 ATP synthase subunit A [Leptolyngbya sp. SIO3F4]